LCRFETEDVLGAGGYDPILVAEDGVAGDVPFNIGALFKVLLPDFVDPPAKLEVGAVPEWGRVCSWWCL
jgi:hypothetical protein